MRADSSSILFVSTCNVGAAEQGGRGQGKTRGQGGEVLLFRGKGSLQLLPEVMMMIQKKLFFMLEQKVTERARRISSIFAIQLGTACGGRTIKIVTVGTTKIVTS